MAVAREDFQVLPMEEVMEEALLKLTMAVLLETTLAVVALGLQEEAMVMAVVLLEITMAMEVPHQRTITAALKVSDLHPTTLNLKTTNTKGA